MPDEKNYYAGSGKRHGREGALGQFHEVFGDKYSDNPTSHGVPKTQSMDKQWLIVLALLGAAYYLYKGK